MSSRPLLMRGSLQPLPLEGGPGSGFNSTLGAVLRSVAIDRYPTLEARFNLSDRHIGHLLELNFRDRHLRPVLSGVSRKREHGCVASLGEGKTVLNVPDVVGEIRIGTTRQRWPAADGF